MALREQLSVESRKLQPLEVAILVKLYIVLAPIQARYPVMLDDTNAELNDAWPRS